MTRKDKKVIDDSEDRGIPIFVITAKDKVSVEAIRSYQKLCENSGCHKVFTESITDKIRDFEDWQRIHPGEVKLPD